MEQTSHSVRPQRIFLDATYTLCSGKNSGVERVVRKLIAASGDVARSSHWPPAETVIAHAGQFFRVGSEHLPQLQRSAQLQQNVLECLPRGYRHAARGLCHTTGSKKLRRWLLPEAGHLGLFKVPHSLFEAYSRGWIARHSQPVAPQSGDWFVLPDAYWARMQVWPAAQLARAAGAQVATVIYDLIPLTHPQFVGDARSRDFRTYLLTAANHSDALVAISQTVCQELVNWLHQQSEHVPQPLPPVGSFPLGWQIKAAAGPVRRQVRQLFDRSRATTPYLMVATFDPRKNHRYLLDAFEQIWSESPDLQLCLVGRVGWLCEAIRERVLTHPRLNRQIHLFHDLNDAEVQHCYRHARGVVFPSIVEGFGLPIVEALSSGCPVFASDTAIHREVGQDDCRYFDLADPTHLKQLILDWEQRLRRGEQPTLTHRTPLDWTDSYDLLLMQLERLLSQTAVERLAA
jgi:O-antigen biosynthesis alpha-1,2-rhamnosyltransferase